MKKGGISRLAAFDVSSYANATSTDLNAPAIRESLEFSDERPKAGWSCAKEGTWELHLLVISVRDCALIQN